MTLGGSPSQGVWITTWTSEMSGRASSGMFCKDRIPAATSAAVAMKTRKRLRTHQSIRREIMLHSSFRVQGYLLRDDGPAVFLSKDANLPCAAASKRELAFVHSVASIG